MQLIPKPKNAWYLIDKTLLQKIKNKDKIAYGQNTDH